MKKIFGFIPTPSKVIGFGTPIYTDVGCDDQLYFHKLDNKSRIIVGFVSFEGWPRKMIILPSQFQKKLDVGSGAVFAISGESIIFVGNQEDLMPYYQGIVSKAGKNFTEELNNTLEIKTPS